MPEAIEKKIKLYKLATELNLASDTLIEFLRKKGHKIKNHMSPIEDDMLRDIMSHFKKEKEVADKYQKKLSEIKETRRRATEAKTEAKKTEVPVEPPVKPVQQHADVQGPVQAEKESELPVQTAEQAPEPAAAEQTAASSVQAEAAQAIEAATAEESVESVKEPVVQPESAAHQPAATPLEAVSPEHEDATAPHTEKKAAGLAPAAEKPAGPKPIETKDFRTRVPEKGKKFGLTIKGKIDLTKPAVKPAPGKKVETLSAEEEAKKKKKKKKKVKDEKPKAKTAVEIEAEAAASKKKKKKKKLRHHEVNDVQVNEAIKRTLAEMEESGAVSTRAVHRKKKKEKREEMEALAKEAALIEAGILRVTEFLTVGELANLMKVSVAEIIQKCISLGMMVSINQRLDKDTIILVADEYEYKVEFQDEFTVDVLEDTPDAPELLKPRAPVVTIMGHVDHGKTSLLDYIRRTNVVAGESGGITQHIGAYEVTTEKGKHITFLDTPGHEAFTAMRARGAQLTDIVVLVIAAEDNVMPQTLEAISHSKAAGVPIIIAINKIDKPEANPDRIRQQLADKDVLVEEWGGKYQSVEVSARSGKNVDLLLEKILLEAELLDMKANPDRLARGAVVEAQLDKGKGILATVLIQKGTLHVGDSFLAGIYNGKVKAMYDERGNRLEAAGPSAPVQLLGFDGIPQAGDQFIAMNTDRQAREISLKRQQLKREQDFRQIRFVTLDDISEQIQAGKKIQELSIIVKGDVDGSVEALSDALLKLSTEEVKIRVIHKGVGAISESDVLLAAASNAIIVGFQVRPNLNARRLAEKEKVDLRLYNIIYNAINELKDALEGMLAPALSEEITATIEVRDTFKVPKIGTVAGCYVTDGKIVRNNRVRVVRDGIPVFEGGIASLKRFKEDVKEVETGFECGIGLENFNDVKAGDIIEAFKTVETKRKLV
ncbi:MAG TPA: translation initiation factor IF-2 [Bacteroidota bacterium]|nr:translation initiation factor IF-2 [Bacteroidota bacterium]